MLLVLDSNIICADFHLKGSDFRVLLDSLPRTGISLCVPEIVIDEAVNKYGEEIRDHLGK